MAFDPVPLAIGQGAVHADDVFRVAANAFSRDSQGVNLPGHLKVTALGTPGGAVTIAAGAAIVRNAQFVGQSYVGNAPTPTQVAIAPNNSASVRRDLVIGRIIDPDFAPWQPSGSPGAPNVSVADGPYWQPYVVSGVPANTATLAQAGISYSGVPLARVDIPANTTNITNAMIADVRQLAQPRTGFAYDIQTPASRQDMLVSDTTFKDWPLNSLQVYVPRWATHMQVIESINQIHTNGIAGDFAPRLSVAGVTATSPVFDYNGGAAQPGGEEHIPFTMAAEFVVTAVQDGIVTIKSQAQRTFTSNTGVIYVDGRTQIIFDVRFSERVV